MIKCTLMDIPSECLEAGVVSYITCVVREVDFMEDLGAVLLDGIHFYRMWGKLSGLLSEVTKHNHCDLPTCADDFYYSDQLTGAKKREQQIISYYSLT